MAINKHTASTLALRNVMLDHMSRDKAISITKLSEAVMKSHPDMKGSISNLEYHIGFMVDEKCVKQIVGKCESIRHPNQFLYLKLKDVYTLPVNPTPKPSRAKARQNQTKVVNIDNPFRNYAC